VPVATSHFSLVLSHLAPEGDSCECVISDSDPDNPAFGSRFAVVRHNIFTSARAIDPFGAQSLRLLAVERPARRVHSRLIVIVALSRRVCWLSKSLGASLSLALSGSHPSVLFPGLHINGFRLGIHTIIPFALADVFGISVISLMAIY
jgi:hypothetical protein